MGIIDDLFGGSSSTAIYTQLNDIAVKACQETIMTCQKTVKLKQNVDFTVESGWFSWISNVDVIQRTAIDTKCALTSKKQNEIKNAIAQSIAQKLEAEGISGMSFILCSK